MDMGGEDYRALPGALKCAKKRQNAFTLPELIVVTVVLSLLIVLILPRMHRRPDLNIKCVNNLKNVGLSFRIFANDNQGKFPMDLSTNQEGVAEYRMDSSAGSRVFKCLSNELAVPKIVICPSDRRIEATKFASLKNQNISYFVGWNSDPTDPTSFLAGDRQLGAPKSVTSAILTVSSNQASTMCWVRGPHKGQGNIGFSDGSVQQLSETRLRIAATNLLATNALVFP